MEVDDARLGPLIMGKSGFRRTQKPDFSMINNGTGRRRDGWPPLVAMVLPAG